MKELIEQLEKTKAWLKTTFNSTFLHIFHDEGTPEKEIANLRQTITKIIIQLKAQDIKELVFPKNKPLDDRNQGKLVSVRVASEADDNKTYIGTYLGELANGSSVTHTEEGIQLNFSGHNPAIYVPELGRVVMGYESWWGFIETVEDFKEITDDDISSVWYVKALKELSEQEQEKETV